MRRRTSVEPTPSPESVLHPTLQVALENLDVRLEDELAYYRRRRRLAQREQAQSSVTAALPDDSAQFLDEGLPPDLSFSLPKVGRSPRTSLARPFAPAQKTQTGDVPPRSPLMPLDLSTQAPQELAYVGSAEATTDPEAEPDYLSNDAMYSVVDDEVELRAARQPGMLETLLTPLGIGSMLLLLLSSVTFGYLLMNPNTFGLLGLGESATDSSSETVANPSTTTALPSDGSTTSLSPNLATKEFPEVSLDTLSTLPNTSTTAPSSQVSPSAPSPSAPSSSAPSPAPVATQPIQGDPIPPAPATRAAAPTSTSRAAASSAASRPAPAPAPSRAASAPRPAASPQPAARPAPARPAESAARPSQPAPQRPATPAAAPSPAANRTAAQSSPYYYVITDYTGDRSLENARQAVDDAYVRNLPQQGAVVQFGAFSEAERAQELTQQLQQQGISARVYRSGED